MNDLASFASGGATDCPHPILCPLSGVGVGVAVRIKRLSAPAEVSYRLREMGFCEEQKIKLVAKNGNYICQVCNARLGISRRVADHILVEPVLQHRNPHLTAGRP